MPTETLYSIILVVGMLLAFLAAMGAVLVGFWLAGRLAGLFGPPVQVVDQPGTTVIDGQVEPESEPSLEDVPWLDDKGDAVPEDPGADPDNWEPVKE